MAGMEGVMKEPPAMSGVRRGWVGKENDCCLYFRMDVPGLGKEDIKVTMDNNTNTLVIEGEKNDDKFGMPWKVNQEVGGRRRYSATIEIPPGIFNTDEISSDVANGVLKVLVPKVNKDGTKYVVFKVPKRENPQQEVDQENPFLVEGVRRSWYAEESESGSLKVRVDMPGLDNTHVRIYGVVEDDGVLVFEGKGNNVLVLEGNGNKESEYEAGGARHVRCKVDTTNYLTDVQLNLMENGVFLIILPPRPLAAETEVKGGGGGGCCTVLYPSSHF